MIKDNIKNLRIAKGLSQKELAKCLDVSFQTISHWESGYTEPPLVAIKKLRDYFGVSYEELLD